MVSGQWTKEAAIAASGLGLSLLAAIAGSVWNLRGYLESRDAAFSVELAATRAQLQLMEFRLEKIEERIQK